MSSLVVNKQYDDPIPPSSAQLDAAFDSIETYLNITGLGADNIVDNSISTAKIADNSVTETKIASLAVDTVNLADGSITLNKLSADLKKAFLDPTGTVDMFSGDTAPTGYLICDGAAIDRTTYVDLFGVVGIRFGVGNGTTTFNIPDLRGRFLRGADLSSGRDPQSGSRTEMNTGGDTGAFVGSVQLDDWKFGEGRVQASQTTAPPGPVPYVTPVPDTGPRLGGSAPASAQMPYWGPPNGSNEAYTKGIFSTEGEKITVTDTPKHGVETRPKNAALNFIIKT